MIFRWLYRRMVREAFGRFLTKQAMENLEHATVNKMSEWEAFKSFMRSSKQISKLPPKERTHEPPNLPTSRND